MNQLHTFATACPCLTLDGCASTSYSVSQSGKGVGADEAEVVLGVCLVSQISDMTLLVLFSWKRRKKIQKSFFGGLEMGDCLFA